VWDRLLLVIILFTLCWPAQAAEPYGMAETPDTLVLSLDSAVRIALENNLNLRAEAYDTRASQALVRKGYGLYDPLAQADLALGEGQEYLNQQFLVISEARSFRRYNFSLLQKLPTGADLTLSFRNQRTEAPSEQDFDDVYETELGLSLVQPLLQGFGPTVTEQEILFAVKDREIAVQDLRDLAFAILGDVRDSYFEVLRLRDNLAYRETSVALAAKILAENRARLRAGVLPPVDVLEAEFGLKQRERDRLDAERLYHDGLDQLALLLSSKRPVAVADETLGQPSLATDPERALSLALIKRPDVQRRQREIERLALQKRIARNGMLPNLDLVASYAHEGTADSYSDDLDEVWSGDNPTWEVGVTFSYPFGNRTARHEYRRTLLQMKGIEAQLAQLKEEVRQEIRAAIRLLEVSRKKIDVTASGLSFAEEKLRILLKRQEVGLATTRQVLEGEEDLAAAQTDWTAALAEYNKAITLYYQVSGTLLDEAGVRFAGDLDDEAYPLLQLEKP
jgi:outer membrane protein TolC